ncbi:MMPL family transporter [Nocardioides sp.]|uniref:MMPL family transporter n=1 Tax=Nocardioides sp. TaxID=35761 RepID=UPI003D12E70C
MSRFLYRLGRGAALHPWRTLASWAILAGLVFALASAFGGTPKDNWDVPGARSQQGIDLLREHVPGAGNASAQVLVHAEGGRPTAAQLTALSDRLAAMDHAVAVSEPRLSADGDTALLVVSYDVPVTDPDLMGNLEPLEAASTDTRADGLQVEFGGELPSTAAAPMTGRGELIGVLAALIILVVAFGSVVAAGLPIAVALVGLGIGSGGLALLAGLTDVSTSAPTVASMVGLGVGIDYALLLVTRHAEFLRRGLDVPDAAGRASATAGRSVLFASGTVLVSLMGLRLAGLSTYSSFGFATAIAVIAVMASALTLVPVLCRFAGLRLLPRGVRKGTVSDRAPLTARWARRVARRPLPWALAAVALMITIALPAFDMRTWPQDASSGSKDLTTRKAFDLVAAEFGPGANGPLTVVVDRDRADQDALPKVVDVLGSHPDLVAVGAPAISPDGQVAVLEVQPGFGPADERTTALIADLRADLPSGTEVTGNTALLSDISQLLAQRLWLVIGFVVSVSVLMLAMAFRSVVVPLKAAVMNLLSIGAAYGVLTAVFQWGWGVELLGLDHAMPVSSWVPILIFAILFGLSMDYEVFLLSRVREDWLDTGDAHESVIRGLSDTGRVITSAAAIMVAVFLGFASEVDVTVKMLGVGMATAIFLDATVVRMVLVPATMSMLGRWNWWLPGWLDRVLPELDLEADEPKQDLTPAAL